MDSTGKIKNVNETSVVRRVASIQTMENLKNILVKTVESGTAHTAQVPGWSIAGKTGTVQNPFGEDHSTFIGFSPTEKPSIAVSVYVENAGYGGTWAAPIASLMIEKHLRDSTSRPHLEKYVLEGNLIKKK